jgi:hypothetical protein
MYVPFVLLLVPYRAGVLSGEGVILAGHVLMLPAIGAGDAPAAGGVHRPPAPSLTPS